MKIQAPNGLVFDLPEAVATGLLSSAAGGFVEYEPAPVEGTEGPSEPEPTSDEPDEATSEENPETPDEVPAPRRRGRPRKNP